MHVAKHVLACTLVGAGTSLITGITEPNHIAMLFAGGVLIDIDHVVYFLWKYGLNIKKLKAVSGDCYRNSEAQFYMFHTWEAILVIGWLVHLRPGFQYFWIGYLLHLGMDIYVYLQKRKNRAWIKKWMLGWQLYQLVERGAGQKME